MIRAPASAAREIYEPRARESQGHPEQHDALGQWGLRADNGVGRRDGSVQPAARQRICQHRPAERRRQARTPARPPLGPRPAGDDHPSPPSGVGRPEPHPLAVAHDHLRRLSGWKRSCGADERLAEFQVEVDRARTVGPCTASSMPGRPGAAMRPLGPRRAPRAKRTSGRRSEQSVLVDGLWRAGVMELGRPVRRADNERNPGVVRLNDGRVELGGGGAARDANDRRPSRRHGKPEAKNAPLRSSSRTWTRSRSAKGSAEWRGREPAR